MSHRPETINSENLPPDTQPAELTAQERIVETTTTGTDAPPINSNTAGALFDFVSDDDLSWSHRGMPKNGAQLPPPIAPLPVSDLSDHDWQTIEQATGRKFALEVRIEIATARQEFWKTASWNSKANQDLVTKKRPVVTSLKSMSKAGKIFAGSIRKLADRKLTHAIAYALWTSSDYRLGDPQVLASRLNAIAEEITELSRVAAEAATELPDRPLGRASNGEAQFTLACATAFRGAGGTPGSNNSFLTFVAALLPGRPPKLDDEHARDAFRRRVERALATEQAV
jgi:hypothetical protein